MVSSDWWKIKWYREFDLDDDRTIIQSAIYNYLCHRNCHFDKLSFFFRKAISNNFPVPIENLHNNCISKVSGEQESNHNSHTFCDIVSIITKYNRWIESTIMIITFDCKNL